MVKTVAADQRNHVENLAIQALSFIASEPDRLGGFLAATGIGPQEIRAAASEPRFLAGVLDYLTADETLLVQFAQAIGIDPAEVARAQAVLAGPAWEREIP